MVKVRLPDHIHGSWIWRSTPDSNEDSFMLMRKTVELDAPGMENTFWISANCAYQLFVNERFVGFGPRANHGERSYVDQYDLTSYLQSGVNALAVIVYHTEIPGMAYRTQPKGLWAQLEAKGRLIATTDDSWDILECFGMAASRPRAAANQLRTEHIDNTTIPDGWMAPRFIPNEAWQKPDRFVPPHAAGGLEIYPLEPATADSQEEFVPYETGRITEVPAWLQVNFNIRHHGRRTTCAANTYLYCEKGESLRVRLYSDDPFRFFCNQTLLAGERCCSGLEVELKLRKGWNRLLLFEEPSAHSMGLFILFPDRRMDEIVSFQEPRENARTGWKLVGALKMPLRDATASLDFSRLPTGEFQTTLDAPIDVYHIISKAKLEKNGAPRTPVILKLHDYVLYRLDTLRYGFPELEIMAHYGDVVDITLGYRPGPNGLPTRGTGIRATHTFRCTEGMNRFQLFNPRETLYCCISVRKTVDTVQILGCNFEELVRPPRYETHFSCSDAMLNTLWEIGANTLRRSSAFIPQIEPHAEYDTYLLDAYIDAVNMVSVFGDHSYAAARLRQFIDAQFENGNIPALTFSVRQRSQVPHLFFLPIWMLYNYRTSDDLPELQSLLPHLLQLRDFFRSLIDERYGLISDIDGRFNLRSRLSHGNFEPDSIPTYANALYCRFLLSSAEIFLIVKDGESAKSCRDEAQLIAGRLQKYNYDPERRLFFRQSMPGGDESAEREYNLFANFTALLGGVMPSRNFPHFFETFFREEPPYDTSDEAKNPYYNFLFLETLFALGYGTWAQKYFREYWTRRICPENCAWLTWHNTENTAPVRFFEGNVLSPNVFLLREFAGVRMASSGHSTIYFNPAKQQLDWADVSLPTAYGKIRLRWEKQPDNSLKIQIEANYPLKVMPEMSAAELKSAEFILNPNVVLLQPPE